MKSKSEIVSEMEEIEDTLIDTAGMNWEYSLELLDDYAIRCWALKIRGDSYPLEQAIRLQEIFEEIEKLMPNVSDLVFEQFCIYIHLLAISLEPVERRKNGRKPEI